MLQKMLELFTTEEKAASMLESPVIEIIFMSLFVLFTVTIITHLFLFFKLRRTRNYLKETNRMDIEPLDDFKSDFEERQTEEAFKIETFVQEKFSGWTIMGLPIISLIKMVQMTISIFILLGVLGTFIGLTISLGSINGVDDQLLENISGVLSGIDIAFYTSIVGMSFSLIMTVLTRLMNTEYLMTDIMLLAESHLEGHEQHGMDRIIKVTEMIHTSIHGVVSAFDGFKDYTSGLKESARDLAMFNEGLSENLNQFQQIFTDMKLVTDGFGKGTQALNKNFDQLFTHFKKADLRNERVTTVFEKAFENIQSVAERQVESFDTFDESVVELKDFTQSSVQEQANMSRFVAEISHGTKELLGVMDKQKDQLKNIFGPDLGVKLTGLTTYLSDLSGSFNRFGDAITPLPRALEMIEQTQATQKQLLTDRLHELTSFNQTFNEHLKNHATESANFERHLRDTSTTFEQMSQKNNQLLLEIGKTIGQLTQGFERRDQQLHSNVAMVKDTFTGYMTNLEGTLAQKLDVLIRNIDNSMYTRQDDMKQEFIELHRMSEEQHDNHLRTQEQLLRDLTREIQALTRKLTVIEQEASKLRHAPETRIEL